MKKLIIAVSMLAPVLMPALTQAEEKKVILKTDNDKISYSVGYQIGGDFLRQGLEINAQLLVKGVIDALEESSGLLSEDEMKLTLIMLKKKIIAADRQKLEKNAAVEHQKNSSGSIRIESARFLQENAKKKNVVTLPSGLQYKKIKAGEGQSPGIGDQVTVNYVGRLINGNEFDSTYKNNKPATFFVNEVIKGWAEALQLMKTGSKWELVIPAELAYGSTSPLAFQTLVFEVELIAIKRV